MRTCIKNILLGCIYRNRDILFFFFFLMMLFLFYIDVVPSDDPLPVYDDSYLKRWHRQLKGTEVGLSRC